MYCNFSYLMYTNRLATELIKKKVCMNSKLLLRITLLGVSQSMQSIHPRNFLKETRIYNWNLENIFFLLLLKNITENIIIFLSSTFKSKVIQDLARTIKIILFVSSMENFPIERKVLEFFWAAL